MSNSKTIIKVIATVLVILILVGGYYVVTNRDSLFNSKTGDQPSQSGLNLEEIKNDFVNRERKSASGVVPPQEITDRYNALIAKSRQAIVDGQPSSSENSDLSWDYLIIANSQAILGQYDEAEQTYLKAIEAFPDNYRANMNLGDLYILMELPQSAAVKFYDTINLYPKDAMIYTKLADLYFKYSKAPEKTQDIYELGWKNSDDDRLLLNYYLVYLETQKKDAIKYEEIKREYEKVLGSKMEQQEQQLEQTIELK
ncbi:MAG: tetratricopeptide repeat protein [Patescibacteria group bacterium]|jgi:tetratricopeptide (TPR) repeat protein